jgi:Ca2+-transporting ATPase
VFFPVLTANQSRDRARADSSASGLSPKEVLRRRALHGPNEIASATDNDTMTVMTIASRTWPVTTEISAALSRIRMSVLATCAASVCHSVVRPTPAGFAQEVRAGRALDALRSLAAPTAHVVRDGQGLTVPARELVPGDLIVLYEGDRVPADARIVSAINLAVDEAALTGESATVHKSDAPLARRCCCWRV